MPHLQGLWSEVAKERNDVEFLAINIGDAKETIENWWKKDGFTLRAVQQEGGSVSEAFGVRAYPTNYVLGPDGRVLYRAVGYEEDSIRAALASTRRAPEAGGPAAPAGPAPDAAGLLWEELRRRHAEAQGLEVRATGRVERQDEDRVLATDVDLDARIARPVHGRVHVEQRMSTGSSEVDWVGVGDALHLIDHGRRLTIPVNVMWEALVLPEPSLLAIWRGEERIPRSARRVEAPGAPADATLLQLEFENRTETYRLVDGLPVAVDLASELRGYTAHYDFEVYRVRDQVVLDDFRALPPEGYRNADPMIELEKDMLDVGDPVPDVELVDLSGERFHLSDLRGRTVVMTFWTENCTVSRRELPNIEALRKEIAAEREDVTFLAVNLSDPVEVLTEVWKERGLAMRPVKQEGNEVFEAFGVVAYPTNYVVDPEGRVVYRAISNEGPAVRRAIDSTRAGE